MSTIVVVRKGKSAAMAADTAVNFGDKRLSEVNNADPRKIITAGPCVLGVIGSPAHRLVVESLLTGGLILPEVSNRAELFEFLRTAHPLLREEYFVNPAGDDGDPYESSHLDLLLMTRHGIFGALSLPETYEYRRFWALGSGSEYALGAMQAVYEGQHSAEQIARIGIESAITFDSGSAADTVTVENKELS